MYLASTYTANDVLLSTKRQFGDEAAVQIADDDILRWINLGQEEIFRLKEPIKASAVVDVIVGVSEYTLPVDVMRIQSLILNGAPLQNMSFQAAEEHIMENDPGKTFSADPTLWYAWGGKINLYPVPNTNYIGGLSLKYLKGPTKVVAANSPLSIPDAFYNRLLEFVLQQAYELDENWQAASYKGTQFGNNINSIQETVLADDVYPTITVLEDDM